MGPSGFLATCILWRKKKQLLQLSLENTTVKGIKPYKGVQVPVKELRILGPVPSRKAVASPNVAAIRAPDLACTEAKERFSGGIQEGLHWMSDMCACTDTYLCSPCARPSIPSSRHKIPEAGRDKSALMQ